VSIHRKLVDVIAQELYENENALMMVLYGSLSRGEEQPNSDIDLMVITKEYCLQKRHVMRKGIVIEFLEMHLDFLNDFIDKREVPVLFLLADGIVLFDKLSMAEKISNKAKKILTDGPPTNPKRDNERYRTKKCSDITEIYHDLVDVTDNTSFNYISTLLVENALPLVLENNRLWPTTRKKTMAFLHQQCSDEYKAIETLLNSAIPLDERRNAAKALTDSALKPFGGMLTGEAVIFRVEKLS